MSASRQSPGGAGHDRFRGGIGSCPRPAGSVVWFLVISAVAFVLRLIHLLQLRHNDPLFLSPQMDSLYHHQWALAIAAGREFIADAFFRAPLYPYFLGLLYRLFGADFMVVRIVQSLIGSAACGLVYLLAHQLLRPQAAGLKPQAGSKSGVHRSSIITHHPAAVSRIAGLVMAAYPLAIWFDGELLLEGLLTFFVLLGLVLLLRSRDTDRQWWLPGIAFGLAVITRPNLLAFLAVLPVWLFLEYGLGVRERSSRLCGKATAPLPQSTPVQITQTRTRRNTVWTRLLFVWGAAVLVILPVTIRNYIVSGQFVPIAWQAGTNFYIGNSPVSDGVTAIVPGTRGSWWGGYDDVKRLAEEAAGRPLKGAEIDRYWMAKGFEFWQRQPGKAMGLLLRKTFLWFAGHEVSNDRDLYAVKRYSFINYLFFNTTLLKFPFGVLLPLAFVGVWFSRSQWRRFLPLFLFVVAYSLSFIVFFVCSRYRAPLVPIAAILAAIGPIGLTGPAAKRERVVALVIAAAAFLVFNANLAGAGRQVGQDQSHVVAAVGLHGQGRDAEALVEVRQALKLDSARSVLSLEAALLSNLGDPAGAERAARAAVRLYPSDADAYYGLGGVLATAGRFDSAAVYLETARSRDPYSFHAWNDLGNIALSRGDLTKARYYYEGALKIRPTFTTAIYGLGSCAYHEGKVAEARALWQEVLRLDPSFTKARQALEKLN
jgi:Tfp pilus assembly protein PilF